MAREFEINGGLLVNLTFDETTEGLFRKIRQFHAFDDNVFFRKSKHANFKPRQNHSKDRQSAAVK